MSRPVGPEGDLSGILQRVNNLRRQRGLADQTTAEYRVSVNHYRDGLLAICSQPDVKTVLTREVNFATRLYEALLLTRKQDNESMQVQAGLFPPVIGYTYSTWESTGTSIRRNYGFTLQPGSHGGNAKYGPLFLNLLEVDQKSDFHITYELPHPSNFEEINKKVNSKFSLDTTTEWRPINTGLSTRGAYSKSITIDDFMRHPEWLDLIKNSLSNSIEREFEQTTTQIETQQNRISQFSGKPVEEVARELQAGVRYSELDLRLAAQNGAKEALERAQLTPRGVTEEQVRIIVAEMITERLGAVQLYPQNQEIFPTTPEVERQIHQLAQGDVYAETLMQRFLRRSRDPQKVYQALLALSQLIPGTAQARAILEAINIMFGPEADGR